MGKLLDYIRAPHPVDAEPLVPPGNYGLIPVKLPPILINIPQPGPEPLNVTGPRTQPVISGYVPPTPERPIPSPVPGAGSRASADEGTKVGFSDRWLDPTATAYSTPVHQIGPQEPAPQQQATGSDAAIGYSAPGIFTPSQLMKLPVWPLKEAKSK